MHEVTSYMGTKLPRFVVDMLFHDCECPNHNTATFQIRRMKRLCVLLYEKKFKHQSRQ